MTVDRRTIRCGAEQRAKKAKIVFTVGPDGARAVDPRDRRIGMSLGGGRLFQNLTW
jgi:hypothetical protein